MGYRSTFISTATYVEFPDWFVQKYKGSVNFGVELDYNETTDKERSFYSCPISSKQEGKMYGMYSEIMTDIQQVLLETGCASTVVIIVLHEDGAVDKYSINQGSITKQKLSYSDD